MKTSTKIILILFAITSISSVVLFPNITSAIAFDGKTFLFNFTVLSYITLALIVFSVLFGLILYFRFLQTLSINKVLFFSTLPFTLIYGALLFFIASINSYDNATINSVKNILNISKENQYNTFLWAILLTIIYILVLFIVYIFVTKPIFRMEKLLERLGDGKIKDKKFNIGGGKQFSQIGHSLLKINNNYKNLNLSNDIVYSTKDTPKIFQKNLAEEKILKLNQGETINNKVCLLTCQLIEKGNTSSITNNYKLLDLYLNIINPLIKKFGGYCDDSSKNVLFGIFFKSEEGLDCAHAIYRAIKIKTKHLKDINIEVFISVDFLEIGMVKGTNGKIKVEDNNKMFNEKIVDFGKLLNCKLIFTQNILNHLPANYFLKYRYIGNLNFNDNIQLFESIEIFGRRKRELLDNNKQIFEKAIIFFNQGQLSRAQLIFEDILKSNASDKASFVYFNKCKQTIN